MASLCNVSKRESLTFCGFCGFWFSKVINQNSLSWAEKNGKNADSLSLKCLPLKRFITPRKVAQGFHSTAWFWGMSWRVSNRPSLKILAFAASDSSKSSINIAYPERYGMGKTPMVTVYSVDCLKALSFHVKLLIALLNCSVWAMSQQVLRCFKASVRSRCWLL